MADAPGSHLQRGARAEQLARGFLERHGLRTVAANYRCRAGELDLLMREGRCLVVVEVRYRASPAPVRPALTVTWRKRQRLLRATQHFLQRHPEWRACPVRLDVLAICGPLCAPQVEWLRGAFTADDVADD